jgi:hypothetical protein
MTRHQFQAVTAVIMAGIWFISMLVATTPFGIIGSLVLLLIYLFSYLYHYSKAEEEFKRV